MPLIWDVGIKGKKEKKYNEFQLNLAVQKLNLLLKNTGSSRNDNFNIRTDPIFYGGVDFSFFRIIPEGEVMMENEKVTMT